MKDKLISIIVPIYNVASYIEQCVRSLMEQSYHNIEYIFIDDASPDKSMDIVQKIVQEYPKRNGQVTLLHHEVNRGLPAARNTGLNQSKGEYVFHCDSDDWVERNMIEEMVEFAEGNNADIVYTDFYLSFHKNERYMRQPSSKDWNESIRSMLNGSMKFNVWNKLIKRKLYIEYSVLFPVGRSMGEDMTIIKLFCHAKKVAYLPKAFYHYMQTNPSAFTKRSSEQQLEQIQWNVADTVQYIERQYGTKHFFKEIQFFKLNRKLPFLISVDSSMYNLWRKWYPEANVYIKQNPAFSFRIRFIQYAAIRKQDWVVKLYNYVVVKLIYGIIYR